MKDTMKNTKKRLNTVNLKDCKTGTKMLMLFLTLGMIKKYPKLSLNDIEELLMFRTQANCHIQMGVSKPTEIAMTHKVLKKLANSQFYTELEKMFYGERLK